MFFTTGLTIKGETGAIHKQVKTVAEYCYILQTNPFPQNSYRDKLGVSKQSYYCLWFQVFLDIRVKFFCNLSSLRIGSISPKLQNANSNPLLNGYALTYTPNLFSLLTKLRISFVLKPQFSVILNLLWCMDLLALDVIFVILARPLIILPRR